MQINNEKGFSVTIICALIVVIMIILTQPLCSIVFYARDMAVTDRLIQQAWFNANSGVEYGRFIIEHRAIYDPERPLGSAVPSRLPWPRPGNTQTDTTFQCFAGDAARGTATVEIGAAGTNRFGIVSTGSAGGVDAARMNATQQTVVVFVTAGRVERWQ